MIFSVFGVIKHRHSRSLPICDAFFIQRGHRRSLPILRKEESDDGHRIKRALYIGIKRLWAPGSKLDAM